MVNIFCRSLFFLLISLPAYSELPPDVVIANKYLDTALIDQFKADSVYSVWIGNAEVHKLIVAKGDQGFLIKNLKQMTSSIYQHIPTDEGDGSVYLITVDFQSSTTPTKHQTSWFLTKIDSFGFFGVSIVDITNLNLISKTYSCNKRMSSTQPICDRLGGF